MCGIAGWFDYSGIKSTENANSVLKKMGQQIAHRGPDGEGIWHNENGRLCTVDWQSLIFTGASNQCIRPVNKLALPSMEKSTTIKN